MSNVKIDKELENAVAEKNLEKVKALVSAGANVNSTECFSVYPNSTLLHICSSADIAKELLLHGANVNARNDYLETPLHFAVEFGESLDLVRELLNYGADVNATDCGGKSALNHAVEKTSKNLKIIKELLKHGPKVNMSICNYKVIKFAILINFHENYSKNIGLEGKHCRTLSRYIDYCIGEVQKMKMDKIQEGLSLYDYVTKYSIERIVCNTELCVKLVHTNYSIHYPVYSDVIWDKINYHRIRLNALKWLDNIQFYTYSNHNTKGKKIFLDYDSKYKVSEYLSNNDLTTIFKACWFNNFVENNTSYDAQRITSEYKPC